MKATETYEVEEISAGVAENCLWVSISFSSKLMKQDVLHVVCATSADEQDCHLGHDSIYLERFDQGYSCYAGAERIMIGSHEIHVVLNRKGSKALPLPQSIAFVVPSRLKGWSVAKRAFKSMASMECGRVVTELRKTSPTTRSSGRSRTHAAERRR